MSNGIAKWLEGLGLSEYAEVFVEQRIDEEVLPDLTDADLKDLGLPLGPRKKLLKAIAQLETIAAANTPDAPAPVESTGAERRQLTVMFCDMAESTAMSERLDPEDLRSVNSAYQGACKAAIEKYEGYVAKYLGDGVLAYFGYPVAHEDDAERAILAGLDLTEAAAGVSRSAMQAHGVEVSVRVGIATGPVVVGEVIGEGASRESAVVGQTPNLAARLQALAPVNGVVISPDTHRLVDGRFRCEDLGTHELKGIAAPVRVRRVIGQAQAESRFTARQRGVVTPLVGREHELGLLLERWQFAREDSGQAVLLTGEPGMGKSRISETLREHTAPDDPIRLRYQCSPYHISSALHPVVEQLQRAAGFESGDPPAVKLEKLESLLSQATPDSESAVPLIASLMSLPFEGRYTLPDMTREEQKNRTLQALVSQMEGLSRRQPVLMIFEDVHWADPTSLDLLGAIIDRLPGMAALAVFTARPEFASPWGGRPHVTMLSLSRLSRALAVSMINAVAGGKHLPHALRDQIIDKTDGVPLFVEELTKTIIESDLVEDRDDGYVLAGPLAALAIPSTLHDALMSRLDRLASARDVAQLAAVIGREFPYTVLAATSELAEGDLRTALDKLVTASLIFRHGTPPQERYVFKHALLRDAAYQSLLRKKRRELHGQIAASLEELAGIDEVEPELIAHHYTEAGRIQSAIPWWLAAGHQAAAHGTSIEAITHLQQGLALLESMPDDDAWNRQEIAFRVALGVPLLRMESPMSQSVRDNYERARVLCEAVGDEERLFPVLWGLWFSSMMRGDMPQALELADNLLENALARGDTAQRLEALHCLWPSRLVMGDFKGSLEHAETGAGLYDPAEHHTLAYIYGGHDPGVCAGNMAVLDLFLTGHLDQARKRSSETLALAYQLDHTTTLAEALGFTIYVSLFCGDLDALERHAEALQEYAEYEQYYQVYIDVALGYARLERGDEAEGLHLLRGAADTLIQCEVWEGPLLSSAAFMLGIHGDTSLGLKLADAALDAAERQGVRWWEADHHHTRGRLLLLDNPADTKRAESCFERAIDIARRQEAKFLDLRAATTLAGLWRDEGRHQAARDLLSPVYGWFTEGFDTPDLKAARALLDRLSG